MSKREDPNKEGHTKEWQNRARVVLDAKKAARTEASPNQSPVPDDENKESGRNISERTDTKEKDDRFY